MPRKRLQVKPLAPYGLVPLSLSVIGLTSLFFIDQQARTTSEQAPASKIQNQTPTAQATPVIPLEVQLKAACQTSVADAYKVIGPFIPGLRSWDYRNESLESYKARLRRHLTFTPEELIAYLRERPKTCETLLWQSYDKRYSGAAFIEEWKDGQYRVGWVDAEHNITQIRVFPAFAEATADYVLFSWGLPRLTKGQSAWYEMDRY